MGFGEVCVASFGEVCVASFGEVCVVLVFCVFW